MWCAGLSDLRLIRVLCLPPVEMLPAVRQVVELKGENHKVKPDFSQIHFSINISEGRQVQILPSNGQTILLLELEILLANTNKASNSKL